MNIGAILAIFLPFEDLQDLEGRHETCEMQIWRGSEFLKVYHQIRLEKLPHFPRKSILYDFWQRGK